jgi:phosphatidylserine/phosphatidylglycerophosphate/cardiolipin synthase-like enzyme
MRIAAVAASMLAWAACTDPGSNVIPQGEADSGEPEAWDLDNGPAWDLPPADETSQSDEAGPELPPWDPGSEPGTTVFVSNQGYLPVVIGMIQDAQESVQVATLEFLEGTTPNQVMAALVAAVGRGVDVKVLLDETPDDNPGRVATLVAAGAQAKLVSSSRTLHVKLVVTDRSRVLVGSTNFSQSSMKYNNEVDWRIDTPEIVERFAKYHDALWTSDSAKKTIDTTAVGGVAPMGDGQYHDLVYPILKSATTRVRLIMYQLDGTGDPSEAPARLLKGVIDARNRGVDVKVVLENDPLGTDNQPAKDTLLDAGVDVRSDPAGTTTHAKLLVMDDRVAIYSGNWTYSGMNNNHEAGAVVTSADLADQAAAYFDQVWSKSN